MQLNPPVIKPAEAIHIPTIRAIISQNLLTTKANAARDVIEQSGFLLRNHSATDLQQWIDDSANHIMLVLEANQAVCGYIMACDIGLLASEFNESDSVSAIIQHHKVLYHKQLGIKYSKQGHGQQLLIALCDAAKARAYDYILCRISHAPYQNKGSIALHEKHGFQCITTVLDLNFTVGIYLKKL